jgi:uncharacterized membrane protein YccC
MTRLGLSYEHLLGVRFAVNVFIATTIVWIVLQLMGVATSPIWAIASMLAACDPDPIEARRLFKGRIINVIVGCATGMAFILIGGRSPWMLPVSLAATVLLSAYIIRVKAMWRQAPITTAIIIAAALTYHSTDFGLMQGLQKVAEVLFGCVVGVLVSLLTARFWLVQPPRQDKPVQ